MNAWLTISDIRAMEAQIAFDEHGARDLERHLTRSIASWAAHRRKRLERMRRRGTRDE